MSCYVMLCYFALHRIKLYHLQSANPRPSRCCCCGHTHRHTHTQTDGTDHSVLAWLDVANDRSRCCRDNGSSISRAHSAMPKRLESVERKNDFVFALAETDSQLTHRLITLSSGVKLSHYSLKLSPSLCVHPRCVTS